MASRAPSLEPLAIERTKTTEYDYYRDIDPPGNLILEVGDPATISESAPRLKHSVLLCCIVQSPLRRRQASDFRRVAYHHPPGR